MASSYFKFSDADLLMWSKSFSEHLSADPQALHVTAQQAQAYALLHAALAQRLATWWDVATRTPLASMEKARARAELLVGARYLVATINNNPATTDAQRVQLGLRIRKQHQPAAAPDAAPRVYATSVDGRSVTLRLQGVTNRRGRPEGVAGASVYTFAGEHLPESLGQWTAQGLFTRTTITLTFDGAAPERVWVTARWYNARGQMGDASAALAIDLPAVRPVPGSTVHVRIAA